MEKYEEMFERLTTDEEFSKKIDEIEAKHMPVKQIAAAFSEAGIDAGEDDVNRLLAFGQMKRFEAITQTEVDEEILKQVTGGGTIYCSYNTTQCGNGYSALLCTSSTVTQAECSRGM